MKQEYSKILDKILLNMKKFWSLLLTLLLMLIAPVVLANQRSVVIDYGILGKINKKTREQCVKFAGHKKAGGNYKGQASSLVLQYQWDFKSCDTRLLCYVALETKFLHGNWVYYDSYEKHGSGKVGAIGRDKNNRPILESKISAKSSLINRGVRSDECLEIIAADQKTKINQATETTKFSFLKSTFNKLSKESRKLVQQRLADLNFYSSAIDGLYGTGTKAAISSYNKEYFASVDLNKKDNVDALLEAIVAHKSVLAKTGFNTDDTEQKICSSANLKHCSVEELCSNGTKQVSGQLQWVTNIFADAAKKKGYSCNVAEIKKPVSCSSNPTACRDDEICALATKADNGVVQWQNNPKFRAHIDAAKTRGLECGVLEGIAAATVAFESGKYNTAFELSQVLAVQGNADAQFYLGKMYEEGLGALQISTLAHMWFNISALNGNEEAPERRKAIQQSMTPAAVEKAQTMALSCIQSRYVDCGAVMPMAPKVKTQQVQKPTRVEPTSSELRAYFVSQSLTERKQIQYALKQLGYYGSSVDGLWGKGTNRALVNYVSNERDITLPSAIYPSLIAKVEVPSRFATVKKKVVEQKPVSTANLSRDGKKCVSNGFSPGTQEYLQCLSYEQQRRQNQSNMLLNLGQGLLQTPSFPAPSTGGLNGGVFCNTMGNYTYCN